jgi:hypothetical protein
VKRKYVGQDIWSNRGRVWLMGLTSYIINVDASFVVSMSFRECLTRDPSVLVFYSCHERMS